MLVMASLLEDIAASLGGSRRSVAASSIKDFWGVRVPSHFMPYGGGRTCLKQAVRLPCQEGGSLAH